MQKYAATLALLIGLATSVAASSAADKVRISIVERLGESLVVVEGVPHEILAQLPFTNEKWTQILRVAVDNKNARGDDANRLPAIFGSYRVEDRKIVFRPRYSFRPQLAYRVTFQMHNSSPIVFHFTLPDQLEIVPTTVQAVYPTADRLPENLLKFYIHFSAPMRQAVAEDHVRLLRADGTRVLDPFVNVGQELWDRSGTRLTLIFDPGRIKHGLLPREQLGPILEAGHNFRLMIDSSWKDASGRPLSKTFEKRFQVTVPDNEPPDPLKWKINRPPASTTSPLSIEFSEPLDNALAHDSIKIVAPDGNPIKGVVTLTRNEQRWQFTPITVWMAGDYSIVVDPRLEDLAAHSVGRPFEVEIESNGGTPPAKAAILLTLSIE